MSLHPSPDQFARPYERSIQARTNEPFPDEEPHPRCVEMAEAMREGATTFKEILALGFTPAEITEFWEAARAIATDRSVRQIRKPRGDLLSDMKTKAREAIQNFAPLPDGTRYTQSLYVAWGAYCAARNAHGVDPWDGQKERCVQKLEAYFRLTTAGPAIARAVVSHVEDCLAGRSIHRARKVDA